MNLPNRLSILGCIWYRYLFPLWFFVECSDSFVHTARKIYMFLCILCQTIRVARIKLFLKVFHQQMKVLIWSIMCCGRRFMKYCISEIIISMCSASLFLSEMTTNLRLSLSWSLLSNFQHKYSKPCDFWPILSL